MTIPLFSWLSEDVSIFHILPQYSNFQILPHCFRFKQNIPLSLVTNKEIMHIFILRFRKSWIYIPISVISSRKLLELFSLIELLLLLLFCIYLAWSLQKSWHNLITMAFPVSLCDASNYGDCFKVIIKLHKSYNYFIAILYMG